MSSINTDDVVHRTGDQTITGSKTFNQVITGTIENANKISSITNSNYIKYIS